MTTLRVRPSILTVSLVLIAALTRGPMGPLLVQARAQTAGAAAVSATRAQVEALASDRFDGRAAGSEGTKLAADYLIEQLTRIGARPLPARKDFRLPFQFTGGVKDGGSAVALKGASGDAQRWSGADTVQGLSFSDTGQVSGQVVFAGYGLVVPESASFSYDSYSAMNVKDKIVVVLRYYPEDADESIKTMLARYSGLRFKALAARERGAKALVVITGPRSPNAGSVAPMTFDAAVAGSGIVAASVGGAVADALFRHVSGKSLDAVQQALDTGNPHVAGFEIPGAELTLDVKVNRERQTDHNIVAYLPPREPTSSAVAKPYVMLGAHYDHLGRGGHGSSLARREEMGSVHRGADDNASGVAAVLAAGAQLARMKRDRGIVLAFWSGEELGLLGSADFTRGPPVPIDQIAAYLNLDMVGRMRDNKLAVQAAGTSSVWPRLIEQTNVPVGFDIQLQNDPNLPTDVASFNAISIPCLGLFTGSHQDYHRPTDVPSSINYPDLDRVARFTAILAQKVANLPQPPDFIKVQRTTDEGGGDRAALRVFTGTIPDYTSEVQGLKLSGVIDGGPAAKAGLQEGDVIVEFAGRTVANIYDYMYALEGVKIGVPVKVVYLRGGKTVEVTLTPEARR
jgi:hypothetical protein